MKNKNKIVLLLFCAFALFGLGQESAKGALVDQQCIAETYDIDDLSSIPLNIPSYNLAQTFTPSLTRLTFIKITVNGDGMGQAGLKLYKGDTFLKRSDLVDEPLGKGEIILSFDEFELTPGDNSYKIRPYISSGNVNISWYRKDDCYSGGKGFLDNVSQRYDFAFKTLGYDDPIPTMEVADPEDFSESDPAAEEEAVEEDDDSEENESEDSVDEEDETDAENSSEEDGGASETLEGNQEGINTETMISEQAETQEKENSAQEEAIGEEALELVVSSEDNQEIANKETDNNNLLFRKILSFVAIAIPVLVILGYFIYRFVKRKKDSLILP